MFKKTKQIRFATSEQISSIETRLNKAIVTKEALLKKHRAAYVKVGQNLHTNSRFGVKKLFKISKKIQALTIQLQHLRNDLDKLSEGKFELRSALVRYKEWFSRIPYTKQKVIFGVVFLIPWLIGFSVLFAPAMIKTIWWSMHDVEPIGTQIVSTFIGFKNYTELFSEYVIDGNRIFKVEVLMFAQDLAINLPIILIFSLLIAVLLNKEFKGHKFVKAVFFIPVIFNFTIIADTLTRGFGLHFDGALSSNIRITEELTSLLLSTGIGTQFIAIVINSVDRIFTIVNFSGIQILIFVAALQSIPKHLYEAALVEGSTKYETFWKITLPMVTPILVTAAVYTVIDSFTRAPIFRFLTYAQVSSRYGLASAIAMSYFLINLGIIVVVLFMLKGLVFYYDDKR